MSATQSQSSHIDRKQLIMQFVKFVCVGLLNTMVTLFVIFLCKSCLGVNPWVSNAIGYIAGVVNSFLWNKQWVFKSHNGISKEAIRFLISFLFCYCIQFAVTILLATHINVEYIIYGYTLTGYGIATVIGMVVYTVSNFILNRFYTFKA